MSRNNNISKLVGLALYEDIHTRDITTECLVEKNHTAEACIIVLENAVVCGLDIVKAIFRKLDSRIKITCHIRDGQKAKKGMAIATLKGKTRAILSGERVALNFLGYLSGVSTLTRLYVDKVKPHKVRILDTRKTIPGLRALEKMAVRKGGGHNHRFSLDEMVLIKDNHRIVNRSALSIIEAIKKAKKSTSKKVEIEVDNFSQFKEALKGNPDIIMLDNMNNRDMKKAVLLRNKNGKRRPLLEASGGITLKRVRSVAQTGVDFISVGALTHSSKDIDFTMEVSG